MVRLIELTASQKPIQIHVSIPKMVRLIAASCSIFVIMVLVSIPKMVRLIDQREIARMVALESFNSKDGAIDRSKHDTFRSDKRSFNSKDGAIDSEAIAQAKKNLEARFNSKDGAIDRKPGLNSTKALNVSIPKMVRLIVALSVGKAAINTVSIPKMVRLIDNARERVL